jgi:hypothetical protein
VRGTSAPTQQLQPGPIAVEVFERPGSHRDRPDSIRRGLDAETDLGNSLPLPCEYPVATEQDACGIYISIGLLHIHHITSYSAARARGLVSEVVTQAAEEPVFIQSRGTVAVVVVGATEHERQHEALDYAALNFKESSGGGKCSARRLGLRWRPSPSSL